MVEGEDCHLYSVVHISCIRNRFIVITALDFLPVILCVVSMWSRHLNSVQVPSFYRKDQSNAPCFVLIIDSFCWLRWESKYIVPIWIFRSCAVHHQVQVIVIMILFTNKWLLLLLHPLNGLFSRTTLVSQNQKGKASLDLNEARDDGVYGWQ